MVETEDSHLKIQISIELLDNLLKNEANHVYQLWQRFIQQILKFFVFLVFVIGYRIRK